MKTYGKNNFPKYIVLIDGVCNLCQGITKFLIKRDRNKRIYFASMQSDAGQRLLEQGGMPLHIFDTFVLIDHGHYFSRSAGFLRLARLLPFPWPLLYGLVIVPPPIRDILYNWVARHRYQWFGKDDVCMIPAKETKERFLD